MRDVLRHIFSRGKVAKRLETAGWENMSSAKGIPSVQYRQFLALLWGIKGENMARRSILGRLWGGLATRNAE